MSKQSRNNAKCQVVVQEDSDQQVIQEGDKDHPFNEDFPVEEENQEQRNLNLLNIIAEQAKQSIDGQRLTWYALYSLKRKEMELNARMDEEIEKLKDKYEMLRQPVYGQISSAALGIKLKAEVYKSSDVVCEADPRKVAPVKVANFWGTVFQKSGLIVEQVDFVCFNNVCEFKSEILDISSGHIRLSFKFNPITDYFFNQQLILEARNGSEGLERVTRDVLVYKGEKIEGSLFTLLFDAGEDQEQESLRLALEISHIYSNSLYFYFREEQSQIEEEEEQKLSPSKKVKHT